MRIRALRPIASLPLLASLCLAPGSAGAAPTAAAMPRPAVALAEAEGASQPDPDLAARLDELRAALAEVEHQRAVLQALRARATKEMAPGELPPDARYPGSVLCRDGEVVYPRTPGEAARAFCAGGRATP